MSPAAEIFVRIALGFAAFFVLAWPLVSMAHYVLWAWQVTA